MFSTSLPDACVIAVYARASSYIYEFVPFTLSSFPFQLFKQCCTVIMSILALCFYYSFYILYIHHKWVLFSPITYIYTYILKLDSSKTCRWFFPSIICRCQQKHWISLCFSIMCSFIQNWSNTYICAGVLFVTISYTAGQAHIMWVSSATNETRKFMQSAFEFSILDWLRFRKANGVTILDSILVYIEKKDKTRWCFYLTFIRKMQYANAEIAADVSV